MQSAKCKSQNEQIAAAAGPRGREWMVWTVPLLVYVIVALPLAIRHREVINPDAVSYVHLAKILAAGDFYHSMSDHWSPLISWCVASLIGMGFDGLYAAHAVLFAWGAAAVITFGLFLRAITSLPRLWQTLCMSAAAMLIGVFVVSVVTPDIIIAACLFAYFAAILNGRFAQSRWVQVLAGLLAGAAYLAKAYALPFVLAHATFTILLRGCASWRTEAPAKRNGVLRRTLASGALMMIAFAFVALPWAGALTWRYGHFTFSNVGSRAHSQVGLPQWQPSLWPFFEAPPGPYICRGEVQDRIAYAKWSPLQSGAHMRRQIEVIGNNATYVARTIWAFDALHLSWFVIAVAVAAGLGMMRVERGRWEAWWILGTMGIYCGGFLPVFFTGRYLLPIIGPMCLLMGMKLIFESRLLPGILGGGCHGHASNERSKISGDGGVGMLHDACVASASANMPTPADRPVTERSGGLAAGVGMAPTVWWRVAVAGVLLASFAGEAVMDMRKIDSSRLYRTLGEQLKRQNITGPIASAVEGASVYTALHADLKYMGFPSGNIDEAERRLLDQKGIVLLVWKQAKMKKGTQAEAGLAEELKRRPAWTRLVRVEDRGEWVEAYVPAVTAR